MRWALLALAAALGGCGDDCTLPAEICEARRQAEESAEEEPRDRPSDAALLEIEEAIRQHAAGLPGLLEALAAPGSATIDWPGGHVVGIEVTDAGTFANDPGRDGFSLRGAFVRDAAGGYVDGWVEVEGLGPTLRIEAWTLSLPLTGRAEVRGEGLVGVLQWPGDGLGYFSGTFREPQTESAPLQFTLTP